MTMAQVGKSAAEGLEQAMLSYLDDLLRPSVEEQSRDPVNTLTDAAVVSELSALAPEPLPVLNPSPSPSPVSLARQRLLEREAPALVFKPKQTETPWVNGRPLWAEGRFDCLLFSVGGLRLSVPLVSLGGVHQITVQKLTPIFSMPSWFLGLFRQGKKTLRVVDTAAWIMPDKYPAGFIESVHYIILLHDSDWALACSDIADAFSLTANEVRWRTDNNRRPWLAGTVIQKMCAILDVDRLRDLLEDAHCRKK
jgi:purine-binding chemotaxis protein CheW